MLNALDDSARRALEAMMKGYEYQSDFAKKYVAQGRREGRREGERAMLLRQLRARFGELPEAAVACVEGAESAVLEQWAARVPGAKTLAALVAAVGSLDEALGDLEAGVEEAIADCEAVIAGNLAARSATQASRVSIPTAITGAAVGPGADPGHRLPAFRLLSPDVGDDSCVLKGSRIKFQAKCVVCATNVLCYCSALAHRTPML
ncbi:DUF4351 domain-containing protein [Sorangium sp. So ce1335]|uniref:DUF4351 domain-containing protein n=1 Tax=Sorangium sp. So ce1335 TaxID=3133335 RepID=UPI003F63D759